GRASYQHVKIGGPLSEDAATAASYPALVVFIDPDAAFSQSALVFASAIAANEGRQEPWQKRTSSRLRAASSWWFSLFDAWNQSMGQKGGGKTNRRHPGFGRAPIGGRSTKKGPPRAAASYETGGAASGPAPKSQR